MLDFLKYTYLCYGSLWESSNHGSYSENFTYSSQL